jgi:hypothetical protein
MKMLEFGVRGFRAGRTLESAIEETIAMAEQAQQQPQQPPADPKAEAEAQKLQVETQRMQGEMQVAQTTAQQKLAEMQARSTEAEQKFRFEMHKLTSELEFRRAEHEQRKIELSASIRLKELQIDNEIRKGASDTLAGMPQEKTDLDAARENVELAQAKIKLAQMQAEYAALVSRMQGFDGIREILDRVGADPTDMAPIAPKKPTDRVYTIVRNENGQMEQVVAQDVPVGS